MLEKFEDAIRKECDMAYFSYSDEYIEYEGPIVEDE